VTADESTSNPDTLDFVRLSWGVVAGREAVKDSALLQACCELYSAHYGRWASSTERAGGRIKMSQKRLTAVLDRPRATVAVARHGEAVVGYCASVRVSLPGKGDIAWVTQLVVHTDYRNERVGTQLLYSTWGFSDCYAWGLATANPLAVRALETATRRTCRSREIITRGSELLSALNKDVNYLPSHLADDDVGRPAPLVDTDFPVDISDMHILRHNARRSDRPWNLGDLQPGHEWFACTIQSQKPALTDDRLEMILQGADRVWLDAYARMNLDDKHAWRSHTPDEVDVLIDFIGTDASVIDVGCGDGRHVHELIQRGVVAMGIDAVQSLIDAAAAQGNAACFSVANAREPFGEETFDAAVMLYDVIGSSARIDDDRDMLRHCLHALRPGGKLLLSVMNSEPTIAALAHEHERLPDTIIDLVDALERLPASNTMEATGDVFDPKYLLQYRGVFYRKEQFAGDAGALPAEHIVRDRRFSAAEIRSLVTSVGFEVTEVRPVQSGRWSRMPMLEPGDPKAKELLVFANRKHADAP